MEKICIDCKYSFSYFGVTQCRLTKKDLGRDIVTGKRNIEYTPCDIERSNAGRCGVVGNNYQFNYFTQNRIICGSVIIALIFIFLTLYQVL